MKTLLTKALSLLIVFCGVSYYTKAQDWQPVGTPGFSSGEIYFPNIVFDVNNTPYVAYLDYFENHHQVRVKKYDGSDWLEVGTTGFPTMADRVSLALDPNGMPVIAYQTFNEILYGEPQNSKIRVKRYTGSNWEDVGTTFMYTGSTYQENAANAYNATLAIDKNGTPYVAIWHSDYLEDENNRLLNGITVVKFNGSSWVTVGEAGFFNQQPDYLTFALDPNGIPYVAFQQVYDSNGFDSRKLSVMKYSGGWSYVGQPSFSTERAYYPSLKIAANGTPYVAYIDNDPQLSASTGGKPTVKKFDGSNWVEVGITGLPDGIGNNEAHSINLELDNNLNIFIAYEAGYDPDFPQFIHGRTRVQKLQGSNWIDVGAGFSRSSYNRDLTIDNNGNPYVIFQDPDELNKANVMRFVPQAVNTAPELAAIGNKSVDAHSTLAFQASATDDGLPNNTLNYSLATAGSGIYPTGATITASGAFTWTPSQAQGQNTYRVKIVVSDGALSDEEEIQIQVNKIRQTPVLSTSISCLPDATLSLSNSADADKIVWYKGDELVSIVLPTAAPEGSTVAGGNGYGSADNQIIFPRSVFVDKDLNVYVVDRENSRIQKWLPGTTSGVTVAGGNGHGASSNQFSTPTGVYVDGEGYIYIADQGNHR